MLNLKEVFEKYEKEYIKFDRIENPLSNRPDLCAFLLLDKLCPSSEKINMICYVERYEETFYLGIDPDKLAKVATEEDILTLVRCGVNFGEGDDEGLFMFA